MRSSTVSTRIRSLLTFLWSATQYKAENLTMPGITGNFYILSNVYIVRTKVYTAKEEVEGGLRMHCCQVQAQKCPGKALLASDCKKVFVKKPHTCLYNHEDVKNLLFIQQLKAVPSSDTDIKKHYDDVLARFGHSREYLLRKTPYSRIHRSLFRIRKDLPEAGPPPLPAAPLEQQPPPTAPPEQQPPPTESDGRRMFAQYVGAST